MTTIGSASGSVDAGGPLALRGRWLGLFVLLWFLMLPVAVIAPVGSSVLLYQRTSLLPFGITILQDDTGIIVTNVWSPETRAAGVRIGDRLQTLSGQRIDSAALRRHLAVAEGETVAFGIVRPGQAVGTVHLPRLSARALDLHSRAGLTVRSARLIEFLLTLSPMLFLVAASAALFRRRRESRAAALMSLAFLLMSASSSWLPTVWRELHLQSIGAPIGDGGWCLFVVALLVFPSGRFEPRWTALAAVAAALWFMITALADPPPTIENFGHVLLLGIAVLALALRYRRVGSEPERLQLKWAFFGFVCGMIALAAAVTLLQFWPTLVAWELRFVLWMPLIGFLLVSLGIGSVSSGLLVALLRYRLYNADAIISRSAGYAILSGLLVLSFGVVSKLLDWGLPALFGREAGPVPEIAGLLIGLGIIAPSQTGLTRWAERRLRKSLVDLREGLPALLEKLGPIASLTDIAEEVLVSVTDALSPERAVLLIGGAPVGPVGAHAAQLEVWLAEHDLSVPAQGLAVDPSDPLFPIRLPLQIRPRATGPALGWLLIGPRPDKSLYLGDERAALSIVAEPIARAVRCVQLRERHVAELEARLASLEARLARRRRSRERAPIA